jgi:radical SAM protein with 4Fe4S-binding SPASM domain
MICSTTGWLTNEEYLTRLNEVAVTERIPLSGSIELTQKCNLRCIHCYYDRNTGSRKRKEINTKEICSLLDDITEAGCLYFLMTGGEPLLRSDFLEIYRYAKERGLIITLFSNGTLINEQIVDLFQELPPYEVEISLYGATASTYEKVTGIPGSFRKCFDAIELLVKKDIHLRLKTILMNVNSHEFFDIRKIAKDLGVKFRFDAAIFPCFNGDRSPLDYRVSPQEAVAKEFLDEENISDWKRFFKRMKGYKLPDSMYHCGAGRASFHIDAFGNLSPCLMTNTISYDIVKSNFLEGWQKGIFGISELKAFGDIKDCGQCEKIHLCGYCPAFFALENGNESIRSDYVCTMGNERYQKIIRHLHNEIENAT